MIDLIATKTLLKSKLICNEVSNIDMKNDENMNSVETKIIKCPIIRQLGVIFALLQHLIHGIDKFYQMIVNMLSNT